MLTDRVSDQPSTPDLLAPETAMGAVTLLVRDIDAMTRFYSQALALTVFAESEHRDLFASLRATDAALAAPTDHVTQEIAVLGRGGVAIIVMRHTPDLPLAQRRSAGLFHTAILFADQAGLAATLFRIAQLAGETFIGSADHLVSEAFYFTDPEGNGIELYRDRPRETWTWQGETVVMGSEPLDPNSYLHEHLQAAGAAAPDADPAVVGHVHLQVGDIATARDFYVDTLGFSATAHGHGALFVSAGGYHHHMAMNTWNSRGAGPRAATLGLGQVAIEVPAHDDVAALSDRLAFRGITGRHDGATLRFEDPWRNLIEVTARRG